MSADTGRWKDYLLKSSLPLEHVVRKKLEAAGFYGLGSFTYSRINEQGNRTEFSVDVVGSRILKRKGKYWAHIEAPAECKYNHPGVRWVFSPHIQNSLVITGCISALDTLTTEHIKDRRSLYKLDNLLIHCARGVEIHSSGTDSNSIDRGLNQLRYALPNLVALRYGDEMNTWHEEDLFINFIAPILVTTAQLFVLKYNVDIDAVRSANDLTEIADEVPALIHHQSQTVDLGNYSDQIARQLYERYPDISTRLKEIEEIRGTNPARPITAPIDHVFEFAPQNILVAQLNSLDVILSEICRRVRSLGGNLERVARLEADFATGVKRFLPP